MWYNVKNDTTYVFELRRGVLTDSPAVEQTVGGFLLDSLANVDLLKAIFQRAGLTAAVSYFDAHVANRDIVRIGDFGEVVAGHLLEDEEGLKRLIEKLRHRESPDWSMKLTDVFCVKYQEERIISFFFGEAKAGSTVPKDSLGQQAYKQVYGEVEDEEPQILFFTLDRLVESNRHEAYVQLDEAMHHTPPLPRALRVVFVFDENAWREDILDTLNEDFTSGELTLAKDFRCYVLTRNGLKDVIRGAYAEARQAAANGP